MAVWVYDRPTMRNGYIFSSPCIIKQHGSTAKVYRGGDGCLHMHCIAIHSYVCM